MISPPPRAARVASAVRGRDSGRTGARLSVGCPPPIADPSIADPSRDDAVCAHLPSRFRHPRAHGSAEDAAAGPTGIATICDRRLT